MSKHPKGEYVEASTESGENVMMNVSLEELYNIPTAEYVHRRGFINRQLTVYHVALHACVKLKNKKTMETLLVMLKADSYTYDIDYGNSSSCGDIDYGVKIFEEYTSSKPPTAELFVTLVEGAMVGYTPKRMQLAQDTLEKMNARGFFLNERMGSDLFLAAAGEKTGGYTTANYIWDLLQRRKINPSFPAVEIYYKGLKQRQIRSDDLRLVLVRWTYDNLSIRSGQRNE